MNLALKVYEWLLTATVNFLDCFPPKRVDPEEIPLRKGIFPETGEIASETIWIHGASTGEIITLRPFMKALVNRYGKSRILVTATTMDGLKRLRNDGIVNHCTLLPVEIPEYLEPFLDRTNPRLVILSETEIWPLLLATLKNRRIPYGIINGRINRKTEKAIKIFKQLFSEAIEGISFVFSQNGVYLSRFASLGIPIHKMKITGSFMFDQDEPQPNCEHFRQVFGFPPTNKIVCFGSIHSGEEQPILDAIGNFLKRDDVNFVVAPRHLNRLKEIEDQLKSRGFSFSKLTEKRQPCEKILLVDTLGDLKNIYAVSTLAFVGGSLVPRGGHNLMEPVVFGVPVVSGPHTENFPLETKALNDEKAIFWVKDTASLEDLLASFFSNPLPFFEARDRAQRVLSSLSGAVQKTIEALDSLGFLPKWESTSSSA